MSANAPLTRMGEVTLVRPPDPPGQLAVHLTVLDGRVVMDFGRALWWVGLDPAQADKLAAELIDAARSARALHLPPGA